MEKILILGGTNFIGRNLVNKLIQLNSYNITLFNRGKSNPDLYSDIKELHGDRNTSDINLIFEENWDYIIDVSCYFPDSLSNIVSQMDNSLKRYIFISTCSVYDNNLDKSLFRDENSPTLSCTNSERIDSSVSTYGNRKAECERILTQSNLHYTILRPSLVYGPYDKTDRFYYWLFQIKKENQLLVPNQGKNIFSITYVNDLIEGIIKSINIDIDSNIYNVTSYPDLSISKLIDTASLLLNKHPNLNYVNSVFLNENNIAQWTDLPLWLDCDYFTYSNKKILKNLNLKITDFEESVSTTIDYYIQSGWQKPNYGLSEKTLKMLIEKLSIQ